MGSVHGASSYCPSFITTLLGCDFGARHTHRVCIMARVAARVTTSLQYFGHTPVFISEITQAKGGAVTDWLKLAPPRFDYHDLQGVPVIPGYQAHLISML